MDKDTMYMKKVIAKSRSLIFQGESPFAAGILIGDDIYIAGNMSRTKSNPNLHAEIVCINEFCEKNDYKLLQDATIYSSCEPCLMCLHSILNAGIRRIVFGASIDDAIKYDSGDSPVHIVEYAKAMNLDIDISDNVLNEEAVRVFKDCITYRGEL